VGKLQVETRQSAGRLLPTKSGIGSAAITLPNGLVVGALVAVNAVGDVIDPRTGRLVAGARHANGTFADLRTLLRQTETAETPRPGEHTTIGVVATNARLTKAEANRVALMADDGYARAIYPSHTEGDGDTLFALATGRWAGNVGVSVIGALAAEVTALAIVRAVNEATGVAGIPSAREVEAARK
jgi:L-aminopeptidase/D-esterase-like protein